jgi:hypothetical protein
MGYIGWCTVGTSNIPVSFLCLFGLFYQPRMIDVDECGAVGGMRIDKGNLKYLEKTCASDLFSPQKKSHYLTWDRTGTLW